MPVTTVARFCAQCGQPFDALPSEVLRGGAKYCNRACLYAAQRIPIAERFAQRVVKSNGCWQWSGQTNAGGYGVIHSHGKHGRLLLAHRVSYELHIGTIPDDLHVLHRCDNPPCTNPDHLFLGTDADNQADKVRKGRSWRKLSNTDVLDIRSRYEETGCTQQSLAVRYGVSAQVIHSIVRHKHRTNFQPVDVDSERKVHADA